MKISQDEAKRENKKTKKKRKKRDTGLMGMIRRWGKELGRETVRWYRTYSRLCIVSWTNTHLP